MSGLLSRSELARRARAMCDRWDRLAAAGLDDYQIRDRLLAAADQPSPRQERTLRAADIPLPAEPYQAVGQGMRDADQLTLDVRDLDPHDVWREMSRWTPTRLAVCCLTLAAARDRDAAIEADLEWVRALDPTAIVPAERAGAVGDA